MQHNWSHHLRLIIGVLLGIMLVGLWFGHPLIGLAVGLFGYLIWTLVQMRRELGRIWESSSASSEQLLHDLQAWCQRAQQSGIAGLEQFAQHLRRYAA